MKRSRCKGLTLLELLVTLAIVSILANMALASYSDYRERTDIAIAVADMKIIEASIQRYSNSNNAQYPVTLADVGMEGYLDPWGNAYEFLNIPSQKGNGKKRKDKNLVPINSDYDLYSKGPDGRSVSPLTAKHSRDDIIRANNGRFYGVAEDY